MRLKQPQNITLENILSLDKLYVAGTNTNLKTGDSLLFVFGSAPDQKVIRIVANVEGQFADNRTLILLAPLPTGTVRALPVLDAVIQKLKDLPQNKSHPELERLLEVMNAARSRVFLGLADSPLEWVSVLEAIDRTVLGDLVDPFLASIRTIRAILDQETVAAPPISRIHRSS